MVRGEVRAEVRYSTRPRFQKGCTDSYWGMRAVLCPNAELQSYMVMLEVDEGDVDNNVMCRAD